MDIPEEMHVSLQRGTCTPMFIAALFTIAKLCKQMAYYWPID
jgi:hypothetical protein